jgi:hypothetical protein
MVSHARSNMKLLQALPKSLASNLQAHLSCMASGCAGMQGACSSLAHQGDFTRHHVSAYARTHVPSLGSLTTPRSLTLLLTYCPSKSQAYTLQDAGRANSSEVDLQPVQRQHWEIARQWTWPATRRSGSNHRYPLLDITLASMC